MKKEELYEAIGNIHDDRIKSAHVCTAGKKPIWVKYGAFAACLCFAVIAISLLPRLNQQPNSEINIIVNPLGNSIAMGDIDAQIDWYMMVSYDTYINATEDEWAMLKADFQENIGMTYEDFIDCIPEHLRETTDVYTLSTPSEKDDGAYILHDYVFAFSAGESKIKLAVSHKGKPVRDWFFGDDGAEASDVNGTAVTVRGNEGCYLVEFVRDGIYYDIETDRLSRSQLEELLVGILFAK